MFSRNTPFDGVMHKNYRKNFSNPPRCKASSDTHQSKSIAMENKAMSEVIVLCSKNDVGLEEIMEYRVTDECLSIFNTNGTMVKVQKSKLTDSFCFTPLPSNFLLNSIAIIDMSFIWRLSTPTIEDREKNDETHFTWYDYSRKMFYLIRQRHPDASTIILVNDPYDLDITVKDSEHDRRSTSQYEGGSKNVFIKPDGKCPNARELNDFFKNKSNKIRLQQFLKTEFLSFALDDSSVSILYSVQSICTDLLNGKRKEEFECEHMEADTIIFYIYAQLRKMRRTETVTVTVIDAEDTDVVVLAARVSPEIDGTLGIKKKKGVFNCAMLCSEEMSKIIVQIHIGL